MGPYHRTFRTCPLGFALCLPPLALWFLWPALPAGWPGVWQLGPLMTLFAYATLVCFCNRVEITVKPRGVWMRQGPFPFTPQPPPILREHIARVYVRRVVERVKGTQIEYLAAGVQRTDGACLDLTEERLPDAAVREHAAAIAGALAWPHPVAELAGDTDNLASSVLIAYLGWAGLLLLSLVWIGIAGALQLGGT
jgi:hypothetical protein